jgi:hypothetical protein
MPRDSDRRWLIARHRNGSQPSGLVQLDKRIRARSRRFLIRVVASSSVMKRSIVPSSTEPGVMWRTLAHRTKRERPRRIPGSAGASRRVQTSSTSRSAVLSIDWRPEASMARARSLRKFAQRLRDTCTPAGTMRLRVWRISARSSGMAAGGWPLSFAKVVTADADRACGFPEGLHRRQADRGPSAASPERWHREGG